MHFPSPEMSLETRGRGRSKREEVCPQSCTSSALTRASIMWPPDLMHHSLLCGVFAACYHLSVLCSCKSECQVHRPASANPSRHFCDACYSDIRTGHKNTRYVKTLVTQRRKREDLILPSPPPTQASSFHFGQQKYTII